jgi:hypothetical protein
MQSAPALEQLRQEGSWVSHLRLFDLHRRQAGKELSSSLMSGEVDSSGSIDLVHCIDMYRTVS